MTKSPWYTRRDLPESLRDLTLWAGVDLDALSPPVRDKVSRRQRAIRAYLQGHALSHIRADCGIANTELLRCLNRCIAEHEDGGIFGWRALLPWQHTRTYVRLAAPVTGASGNGGSFMQFLRDHPEIATPLDEVILKTKAIDALRESRYSHKETYGHFRRLCLRAGIPVTRYPLNAKDDGRRAVRRYALELLKTHFSEHAARTGGTNARLRARIGLGVGRCFSSEVPFDLVSIDAHRLNFIGCIGIPTSTRIEVVPIQRFQLLPVVEHYSRAVLGYEVAITREPGAHDVIKAVRHALTPWSPRKLTLPGHAYPDGAMLPSALPDLRGLCWSALLIDNASIHCSTAVAENLRKRLGCALNFGPVRRWYRRPLVESVFSALERAGFLRLPNTTGTGPADPQRPDAVANAVKYEMLLEEMLDLIDIVICTYDATVRDSLGKISPLERLSEAVLAAPAQWLPRSLPPLPPWVPELGAIVLTLTVRGSRKQGRRPYIQYEHVRYSSPVLSQAHDLIGQKIRVHVQNEDLRTVKAFLLTGEELGILNATGGWDRTRHDLSLRQHVLRAAEDRTLIVGPGEDPIQTFLVLKAQQALTRQNARRRRRPTVSQEATALVRAARTSEQPVPEVDPMIAQSTPPPLMRSPTIPLPSFVPPLRHRGVQK